MYLCKRKKPFNLNGFFLRSIKYAHYLFTNTDKDLTVALVVVVAL